MPTPSSFCLQQHFDQSERHTTADLAWRQANLASAQLPTGFLLLAIQSQDFLLAGPHPGDSSAQMVQSITALLRAGVTTFVCLQPEMATGGDAAAFPRSRYGSNVVTGACMHPPIGAAKSPLMADQYRGMRSAGSAWHAHALTHTRIHTRSSPELKLVLFSAPGTPPSCVQRSPTFETRKPWWTRVACPSPHSDSRCRSCAYVSKRSSRRLLHRAQGSRLCYLYVLLISMQPAAARAPFERALFHSLRHRSYSVVPFTSASAPPLPRQITHIHPPRLLLLISPLPLQPRPHPRDERRDAARRGAEGAGAGRAGRAAGGRVRVPAVRRRQRAHRHGGRGAAGAAVQHLEQRGAGSVPAQPQRPPRRGRRVRGDARAAHAGAPAARGRRLPGDCGRGAAPVH